MARTKQTCRNDAANRYQRAVFGQNTTPRQRKRKKMSENHILECKVVTELKISYRFLWHIASFKEDFTSTRQLWESPVFTAEKHRWTVHASKVPSDVEGDTKSNLHMNLALEPSGSLDADMVLARYEFKLHDAEFTKVYHCTSSGSYEFFHYSKRLSTVIGFFISEDDLFDTDDGVSDVDLYVSCTISIIPDIAMSTARPPAIFNAVEQFASILGDEATSDVVVHSGERKFRCHRAVLRARSSVFRAMFEHKMLENERRRVEIKDVGPEVLGCMIEHIYRAESQIPADVALELLTAADMYDLPDLKLQCEHQAVAQLAVANVVDSAIVADRHGAKLLRKHALAFVRDNVADVLASPGWRSLFDNGGGTICGIVSDVVGICSGVDLDAAARGNSSKRRRLDSGSRSTK